MNISSSKGSSQGTQKKDRTEQPTTVVTRKLRRADDYAKILAAPTATTGASTGSTELSAERIAAAVDAVGRLQTSRDQMDTRLAVMRKNLETYLPASGKIVGEAFVAEGVKNVEHRLLKPQKITTYLMFLLSEIEENQASHGGLFDVILSLDESVLNEYFVPLLKAVFEKEGMSDRAAKLFMETSSTSVEVKPLAADS